MYRFETQHETDRRKERQTGRRTDGNAGPDLSVWRPWAGSLLEALPTLKCYNLHALTIVIITKYTCIYIYFYTL